MYFNNDRALNPFHIVAIVGIVVTGLTICYLANCNFNSKVSIEKEKIEVTAYNSNQIENE